MDNDTVSMNATIFAPSEYNDTLEKEIDFVPIITGPIIDPVLSTNVVIVDTGKVNVTLPLGVYSFAQHFNRLLLFLPGILLKFQLVRRAFTRSLLMDKCKQ